LLVLACTPSMQDQHLGEAIHIPAASLNTNCGCASFIVEAITTSSFKLLYREQNGLHDTPTHTST
jgi:hypothetical protein